MRRTTALLIGALLALPPGCGQEEKPLPDANAPDQGLADQGPLDQGPKPDKGIPPNSGLVCASALECAAGDACLPLYGSQKKICLTPCDPQYPACPVPNPAKHSSLCALKAGQSLTYCLWVCLYQGKPYECPVPNAYDCVAPNPTEPNVKICIPK